MNTIADRCHICSGRSRGLCLSSGKAICSSCCGSKRGTDINCVSDCSYYPFSLKGYDLWLNIDSKLILKMIAYTIDTRGKNYFAKVANSMVFNEESELPERVKETSAVSALFFILFVEKDKEGKILAEYWKNSGWNGLTNDEQVMMKYKMNCRATIIEIQKIPDAQSMECVDLLDPQRGAFVVFDRNTAARVVRFSRLFVWLIHYQYFSRVESNGIEIPDFIFEEFMDLLKEGYNKKYNTLRNSSIKDFLSKKFGMYGELINDLALEKRKAVLKRMDLHQCKAWYKIKGKFDEVKAVLDNHPDFQQRDKEHDEKQCDEEYYYDWLRKGESKALENEMNPAFRHDDERYGVGILGNISLSREMLVVEVFSEQKFKFAKKIIKKYFKKSLVLHNECIVDLAKQMANKNENNGMDDEQFSLKTAAPKERVPEEIQRKIMNDFYRQHYRRFLDEQIPALDNLTPRQTAGNPIARQKLVKLMKEHLKSIEIQNKGNNYAITIDWVLNELNLPELK